MNNEKTTTIKTPRCFRCGEFGTLEAPISGIELYNDGALIQDAFPDMPREDREQIISGTHPKCWKEMFS